MAPLHHLSLATISVQLLLPILAAASAAEPEEPAIRISVQYATEEESRWLDRWSEKYQAQESGSDDFSVHPATVEESAYLNSMFSDGKKRGGEEGGVRAGFDGHIEFDDDHPFSRMVVDTVHSQAGSSKPNDDLQNNVEPHAEYDVKDL